GRWNTMDKLSELYFGISSYVYAKNTPIQAIDPDGNLVIFINGMHAGSGGTRDYWKGKQVGNLTIGGITSPVYRRFDSSVMKRLNDFNSIYYDGAMGGATGPYTFGRSLASSSRQNAGEWQGYNDAKTIIASLEKDQTTGEIIETIKIITHSMGGAYGKGFLKGLKKYSRENGLEKQVRITSITDFDPNNASSLTKDADVFTQQSTHIGGLADERQEGLSDDNYYEDDKEKAHAIMSFFSDISKLQEGTYIWNEKTKEMECTNCNNQNK